MTVSNWLRAIRVKFLLASVIAVSAGLALSWWQTGQIVSFHAILTMAGVLALHVSVDLLNDYWDYKRGIDTATKRTKMSGGSGVLPEGLLEPKKVYRAGIVFLIIGAGIGSYFVLIFGFIIGIILAFAVLSIYFYSTKIVNWGLAEVFVTIKGTMIVLGTYFIQTNQISESVILAGLVVGILSSFVLFITSFPDYFADKSKGRRTLVIVFGKQKAVGVFWVFPIIAYSIIVSGVILNVFPNFGLLPLLTIPLLIKCGVNLKKHVHNDEKFLSVMGSTLLFSRITGALFVLGFILDAIIPL